MNVTRLTSRFIAGTALAASTLVVGGFFPGAAASASAASASASAPASASAAPSAATSSATTPSAVTTSSARASSAAPASTGGTPSSVGSNPGASSHNLAPGTTGMALRSGSAALSASAASSKRAQSASAPGASNAQSPAPVPGNDLIQGTGPIMKNPVIYNVFWLPTGHHYESDALASSDTRYENLINRWAADIGGSNYYNLVTQYPGSNGTPANAVTFGGSWVDTAAYPVAGTQAAPLLDSNIQAEATNAATTNGWVQDGNHIYLVYTGFNVFECQSAAGDCNYFPAGHTNAFCAYHFFFGGSPTIYAFMGSDDQSGEPGGCSNGQAPNGDAAADSEISSATHEFIESVTDPKIDNWLSSVATGQQEIGDLCNRVDGPNNVLAPGADVYLNGDPYDVQMQWSNAVHACATDLNGAHTGVVPPVLQITKSAPSNAVTGQQIPYSITVTNPSNTDASTLTTVTDTLPAGVTYVPGSANIAPTSTSPLTWNLATLAVHDTTTINFRATSNPQSVNNCANVAFDDQLQISAFTAGPGCAATAIAQASTTTAVTSTVNPSVFGQTVTLKATVTVNAPGAGIPSGGVQFFDGATPIGSGTLNGANPPSFSVITSSLSVGSHPITASYAGDGNFFGGTSGTLNQVVHRDATTTVVTSNANPSVFGQPVTLTGTVTANAPGSGTPTGNLQFFDGPNPIGSGSLVAGHFAIVVSTFNVATHPITAHYGGDGSFLASTSAVLSQVVNKAPTATSLTANPAGSVGFGHPVTFTATVSVPPPGAGNPTGPVIFSVDGTPVQTVNLNVSEQASVTTSSLSPGSHLISAAYQGDDNFLASTGTLNYLVTCTVTVTGNHPGALLASGDSTCVVNATVGGSIIVPKGTSLAVINSTVNGSINATNQPNAIEVCGSHFVGGSVSVINAGGLVIVGDPGDANCAVNTVSGTLLLRNNTHGVEAIGNTVGGLVVSGNSGPGPFPGDGTTISGNIISH